MQRYVNSTNLPLSVAVFLATDHYDAHESISATSLIKSVRQIILTERLNKEDSIVEIQNLVASRIGSAIHSAIEVAWNGDYREAIKSLGYPQHVADKVVLNPTPEQLKDPDIIPCYLEQRTVKLVEGIPVSGKFDFIFDGLVEDFKSTSVGNYLSGSNVDNYIMQGSIYRWLNPEIITKDEVRIIYILTDWKISQSIRDQNYPKKPCIAKTYPLLSYEETERFVINKIKEIIKYRNKPEKELPKCNDKELWRREPVFKYYKDPTKLSRSTKNFKNAHEAYRRRMEDGNIGIVKEVPGQAVACNYCPAFTLCSQKDELIADGSLTIS